MSADTSGDPVRGGAVKTTIKKKIVTSGSDKGVEHRTDFESCPSCDRRFKMNVWRKHASVLVLEPAVYKTSAVSVVSECPECFEKSWVHEGMNSFSWCDEWPEEWKLRVDEKCKATKLDAARKWGASLCWNCIHLQSASIDFNAWRSCKRGTGPAETVCSLFRSMP